MGEYKQPPDRAGLERLSTDELKELIRADADSTSSGNEDYIFMVLEVIAKREKGQPDVHPVDVDRAWERFQRHWNTPDGNGKVLFPAEEADGEPSRPPKPQIGWMPWKRLALVAAIIVALLAGMLTAQAAGIDIRGIIARWTDDVFYFEGSATETNYQSEWAENLIAHGLEASLIPTCIPEGFEAGNLSIEDHIAWVEMHQPFSCPDGRSFQIVVQVYSSPDFLQTDRFEKDKTLVSKSEHNGSDVYSFANSRENTVTLVNGLTEVSVIGSLTIESLEHIINSIGGTGA